MKDITEAERETDDSIEDSSASREISNIKPGIDLFDDKQTDLLKANAMSNFLVS